MKIISTEIKNLEPVKTITLSHIGDYAHIENTFGILAAWAVANNLWDANPKVLGVYHDDPMNTPVEKLRSEACIEDLSGIQPGEGMYHYTISGGKYFVMRFEVTMAEYGEAWKQVYVSFNEKGYECDERDHFELYGPVPENPGDENSTWEVDICIPMK